MCGECQKPYDITYSPSKITTDAKGKDVESDCAMIDFKNQSETVNATLYVGKSPQGISLNAGCSIAFGGNEGTKGTVRTRFRITFDGGTGEVLVMREYREEVKCD